MSQPGEEQEEVKELVSREELGTTPRDSEEAGERVYREGHDPPLDDPENDAARGSWGWILLVAIVVAIVAYVVYLVLS